MCTAKKMYGQNDICQRCLVPHSDFRFIYCIEVCAANLEKLSHKVMVQKIPCKMCYWIEKVPYQYLKKENSDGPVSVVFSYLVIACFSF